MLENLGVEIEKGDLDAMERFGNTCLNFRTSPRAGASPDARCSCSDIASLCT